MGIFDLESSVTLGALKEATLSMPGVFFSVEKKWKKVYVTYRNAGSGKLKIYYSGVAKSGEITWTEISQSSTNGQFASSGNWTTTGFKINTNAYSMRIKIESANPGTDAVPYNFEINDITFVYRTKTVK